MRQQTFEEALKLIRADAFSAMERVVELARLDSEAMPSKADAEAAFKLLSETMQRIEKLAEEALK